MSRSKVSMQTIADALHISKVTVYKALNNQPYVSDELREKILRTLNKEIPHGVAVVIEQFTEDAKTGMISIRAEIYCEKASHKGIIVGKNGQELKLVGSYARADLEELLGSKVYLNLWVKVKPNWREDEKAVMNFGYNNKEDN